MISAQQLDDFFTAYGGTLAAYDAEASAALWGTPGLMLADGFAGVLDSREEMAAGLAQGYPLYRQAGLASVTPTLVSHEPLTERIARARVRWSFLDAAGEELTDSTYEYTVHADDDALRVYVAISIDAEQKLAELLDRLGITPPG